MNNLYVHFPFCRAKCAYCALHSSAGSTVEVRRAYCERMAEQITALDATSNLSTIYFGGGSPALCDLSPLFDALRIRPAVAVRPPSLDSSCEFTVELHPLDAQPRVLELLKEGGVNRISSRGRVPRRARGGFHERGH